MAMKSAEMKNIAEARTRETGISVISKKTKIKIEPPAITALRFLKMKGRIKRGSAPAIPT